ncbi:CotH kinase family protein [Neolewinella persica]|uniref:CotH kinase family protein n=1 Tax=Neolewinella persica TaxID=70998 RepID=UPI00036A2B42|nr:CotH kinase family protein [Neolewinella persica]
MTTRLLLLCLFTLPNIIFAQVRLNEAVSSNSIFLDEDDDSPDWFELYNPGTQTVDLSGYTLSDKADNPGKWTIPNGLTLAPDQYAFFWASDKDRSDVASYRTLVNRGDDFRYLIPTGSVDDSWTSPFFDDAAWAEGPSGFGYDDGDDATIVPNGTSSVFLRRTFTVNTLENLKELFFDVDFDDGFVAYLNGTEIARFNMVDSRPAWNAFANNNYEARIYGEGIPLRFVVADPASLLVAGENLLSIQVHNVNAFSSDMSMIPFLTARYAGLNSDGVTPPTILSLPRATLHTNFKLSVDGETLFLHDTAGVFVDSLRVHDVPANVSIGIPGMGGVPRLFRTTTPGERNPDTGFAGLAPGSVIFSQGGGPTGTFALSLAGADTPYQIRYTLDATEPAATSPLYTAPLAINTTTVVRAAIFRPDYLPSTTQSETYLIGTNHSLPVVTLVTEPDNFFHPVTGMYVLGEGYEGNLPFFGSNIWEEIENPINFTFHEPDGSARFQFDGGVKIFGGWSRANDQRSLSLFARSRYGVDEINYGLFPQRSYTEFQALVLRNAGNDNGSSMLRDVVLTSLMENSNVDIQAYRSVATYLNGEYWGLYNLREKVNEHYLASLHGHDPDEINMLEFDADVIQGSNEGYRAMIDFMAANTLTNEANYRQVADQIDLDNFIQYFVAQIYYDNTDWPGNNIKYWQPDGGKWRWILFDTDFGAGLWNGNAANANTLQFALEANGPNWPNPPWSTFLFRRMMENTGFRHRFINQLADEMNSRFLPTSVIEHINRQAAAIESEIPLHQQRWEAGNNWRSAVESIRRFFRNRAPSMKNFVKQQYNLPAHHQLTVRITDTLAGYVEVNSLTINENVWSGDYFQNIPIRVKAVAKEDYTFQYWELDITSSAEELNMNMFRPMALRPVFTENTDNVSDPNGSLTSVRDIVVAPNPSTGLLRLSFTASRSTHLTATLIDAQGRVVRQLFDADFRAGTQVQSFGLGDVASGAYWLELREPGGGSVGLRWLKQ